MSSLPFGSTLLSLPSFQRADAIMMHFQPVFAAALALSPQEIDNDAPIPAPYRLLAHIRNRVMDDLGLPLYPCDAKYATSIREFAQFLARESVFEKPPDEPLADLYSDGQWAWGAVEPLPEEKRDIPICFVLSALRSGSTLLRVMLSRNPQLFSPPELYLLAFSSLKQRLMQTKATGCEWMQRGLVSALMEAMHISSAEAKQQIARMTDREMTTGSVYAFLHDTSRRLVIDKTPPYAFHPMWLRNAERLFSGARYIHLVRNPHESIASFVRMRFHWLLGRRWLVWDQNPWRYAEKCWTSANLHITDFLRVVSPERQLTVRYEDLVDDPRRISIDICKFLGIDYDPAMLSPYEEKMTLKDYEINMAALGDPNFLTHNGIQKTTRPVFPNHMLGEITKDVATSLGYVI